MIGVYAKPKDSSGISDITSPIDRFYGPLLVTEVYKDKEHNRCQISGLWFNNDELEFFTKEDYPELYL